MRHLLPHIDSKYMIAIITVNLIKPLIHLFFGTKGFDDAQSSQRFLDLTHGVAPETLCLDAILFKFTTDNSH